MFVKTTAPSSPEIKIISSTRVLCLLVLLTLENLLYFHVNSGKKLDCCCCLYDSFVSNTMIWHKIYLRFLNKIHDSHMYVLYIIHIAMCEKQ